MSGLAPRPAAAGDAEWVFALAKSRPYTAKWPAAALTDELARPDSIFLVIPGKGYALARVVDDDCRLLDLASAVDGNGAGRALMDGLKHAARQHGCAKLSFEVSAANARALSFYEKAGARVVGRRPKFYYDGADAVLMDLDLR